MRLFYFLLFSIAVLIGCKKHVDVESENDPPYSGPVCGLSIQTEIFPEIRSTFFNSRDIKIIDLKSSGTCIDTLYMYYKALQLFSNDTALNSTNVILHRTYLLYDMIPKLYSISTPYVSFGAPFHLVCYASTDYTTGIIVNTFFVAGRNTHAILPPYIIYP